MVLMFLLIKLLRQCRRSLFSSNEWTLILRSYIAITVSLGRSNAWIIYSIFPLCMGSNTLEKSTKTELNRTPSLIQRIVRIYDVVDQFLKTKVLIFSQNILNFRFDTIEMRNIINLNSYRSNSLAFVVLSNSAVTFIIERKHAAFCPSL